MSQLQLDILPVEIREKIYNHLIKISSKGEKFKEQLQTKWFEYRINRLVSGIWRSSETYKDLQIEQVLYDVDELDLKLFTRNKFHHCLRILSALLTPDRLKTRWMFHIFGYDASTLTYLNTHIANNYLRGYITADGYLLGYVLLLNDQQNVYDILGSFSYIWRMDCMLLNRIDKHVNRFQTVSVGNHELREELLKKNVNLSHKSACSIELIEGSLKCMLPEAFLKDILH